MEKLFITACRVSPNREILSTNVVNATIYSVELLQIIRGLVDLYLSAYDVVEICISSSELTVPNTLFRQTFYNRKWKHLKK